MLGLCDIKEGEIVMPVMLRHNHECDAKLWFGEIALNGFEENIFTDDIMGPPLFDAYDDFINHSWPLFVEDNSYS